jgi:hypothetical protein
MAFVVAATLLPQPGRAALGAALLAVAVVLAGLFIVVDRRSTAPLLPKAVLGLRPLRQGAAGALLNTLTTSELVDCFGIAIGYLTCAPRGCWEYDTASEPALRVVAALVDSG